MHRLYGRLATLLALAALVPGAGRGACGDCAPELRLLPDVPTVSGLFRTNRGKLPPRRIDLEATWRGEAVVVRLREFLPPGVRPQAKGVAARPISMFECGDATVEVFVRPDPARPEDEYQISVNPSNLVYSARNHEPWAGFAKPCTTRPFFGADHWGVEFTLPFGAFGEAPPRRGESRDFEFAVGPYRWRSGLTLRYGRLVFGEPPAGVAVEAVSRTTDGVLHVTYAVDARFCSGERAHKGIRRDDVGFDAAGVGTAPRIVRDYAAVCDVLEFALSYGPNPLLSAKETFGRVEAAAQGRPLVVWVGASLPERGRHRTPDELNSLVRYAILRGAVGCVWHLGHGSVPQTNARLWSYLRGAERLVNAWYPDWVRGTPVDLGIVADPSVAVAARRTGVQTLILAVNLSPVSRTLTYVDPKTASIRRVTLTGFGSALVRRKGE